MRWFLGLLLVVALITGVLYVVGRFLLPNTLDVTQTVSIARPRASIFAMINDLRIGKEWSPYYALDPEADYQVTGEPGAGQAMRWNSDLRQVGEGRMSIVTSTQYEGVDGILEMGDRARLDFSIRLQPSEGATAVVWTVSAICAPGNVNVPCRYMNLILRSRIDTELQRGLARLKQLAETLPPEDFEGVQIEALPVEPQPVLFVEVSIATFKDREDLERDGIAILNRFLAENNTPRPDALVRVFPAENGQGGRFKFYIGYPYDGPAPLRMAGIYLAQTPGGPALRATFAGRRSQIPIMYQQINAYRQAHCIALRPRTDAWEIVRQSEAAGADGAAAGDPVEHTEIFYPITPSAGESAVCERTGGQAGR
jgi:hypothetical protein